jgi:hypothetical protein
MEMRPTIHSRVMRSTLGARRNAPLAIPDNQLYHLLCAVQTLFVREAQIFKLVAFWQHRWSRQNMARTVGA